jgi:hypothetical protein
MPAILRLIFSWLISRRIFGYPRINDAVNRISHPGLSLKKVNSLPYYQRKSVY